MITIIPGGITNEYFGPSTEDKPSVHVPNGSTFYEFDTVKLYVYDADLNEWIEQDLPVSFAEYDKDFAKNELKAHGSFWDRYPDKVKVYTIGDEKAPASREVCGGPHVEHTGVLGHFKIQKDESSSAGVRRIKAILE